MTSIQPPSAMSNEGARSRYANAVFGSRIFEPQEQAGPVQRPAGRRRDQTTAELFGNYEDKPLKAQPKTFVPKGDDVTARQRKLEFLSSEVLPRSEHKAQPAVTQRAAPQLGGMAIAPDVEGHIDPIMRRQQELSSELFGRETPAADVVDAHDLSSRLTPTDFKWFSVPKDVPLAEEDGMDHRGRSYQEKCSQILNHVTPGQTPLPAPAPEEVAVKTPRRLQDADLDARKGGSVWHPKHCGSSEEKIIVHGDWTNSKTEIMCGARGAMESSAAARKHGELHTSCIFGYEAHEVPTELNPVTTDNASKTRAAFGSRTQDIHQAHLKSSMTPDDFYTSAASNKAWEVRELYLAGLPGNADEVALKRLCQGFDLQIVKVSIELDPATNVCRGRAKVMVRYNPGRSSVDPLVQRLEEAGLFVQY